MLRSAHILALLLLSVSTSHAAESDNYCLDKESNKEWSRMYSEHPNDNDIAKLFALRTGLCEMVRRKRLTIERATKIFEEERQRIVNEKKIKNLQERDKTPYS